MYKTVEDFSHLIPILVIASPYCVGELWDPTVPTIKEKITEIKNKFANEMSGRVSAFSLVCCCSVFVYIRNAICLRRTPGPAIPKHSPLGASPTTT